MIWVLFWLLNMSSSSKRKFPLKFLHFDPKRWIEYGVTRHLDSEEVFLYQGEHYFISSEIIDLRTCELTCLNELVE